MSAVSILWLVLSCGPDVSAALPDYNGCEANALAAQDVVIAWKKAHAVAGGSYAVECRLSEAKYNLEFWQLATRFRSMPGDFHDCSCAAEKLRAILRSR